MHLHSSDRHVLYPRVVQYNMTALGYAVFNKNDAMVKALLDHNADVNVQDDVR